MRHLLLFLALLLSSLRPALAQVIFNPGGPRDEPLPLAPPETEAPRTAFADSLNAVFQFLDKSRVPSGLLEDYGWQLTAHTPYSGTSGFPAANQLDLLRWRRLYAPASSRI